MKVDESPSNAGLTEKDDQRPHNGFSIEEIINKAKGQELYGYLFNEEILRSLPFQKSLVFIRNRLEQNYPRPASQNDLSSEIEIVSRTGLLKALGKTYDWKKMSAHDRSLYVSFHKEILESSDEKFIVRVQAARNLNVWSSTLSSVQRNREQAGVPASILLAASKTERQLAEEVLANEK